MAGSALNTASDAAPALSAPFARVLEARRGELNARFADARHRMPGLEPGRFVAFLRDAADPVVRAVAGAVPERTEAVALAAYDVALEVVGQQLVADERGDVIRRAWQHVLPASPRVLAADAPGLLVALTNAAHHISATPGAQPARWLAEMAGLAGRCATADELRRLGQVAAWRAGLAHYRAGALAAAACLPEPLTLAAVGAPAEARWDAVARGFAASEWYDPARAQVTAAVGLHVAATVGAFRGLGGLFVEPPRVTRSGDALHVTSGGERWLLTADRFGATFHRVPAPTGAGPGQALPPHVRVTADGLVTARAGSLKLAPAGHVTSAAATATTLAVTWSHTHHLTLVALA